MTEQEPCAQAASHSIDKCCTDCHAHWEGEGEPMQDGNDEEGYPIHVCCTAAIASDAWLKEHGVPKKLRGRDGR